MIHKFFISTYQKTPIVKYLTYNTIKTNTYYIICSHRKKTTLQAHQIADIIDSINTCIVN